MHLRISLTDLADKMQFLGIITIRNLQVIAILFVTLKSKVRIFGVADPDLLISVGSLNQ